MEPDSLKKQRKSEYFKRYYAANRERLLSKKKRLRPENAEKLIQQSRAWHKENPERSLLCTARTRARKAGLPFDLRVEDIIIPQVCPVLGIPLLVKRGKRTDNTPSLDRLIPERGYIKDNVCIISWRANRLKCDATPEETEKIYHYVKKNLTFK